MTVKQNVSHFEKHNSTKETFHMILMKHYCLLCSL